MHPKASLDVYHYRLIKVKDGTSLPTQRVATYLIHRLYLVNVAFLSNLVLRTLFEYLPQIVLFDWSVLLVCIHRKLLVEQ